MSIIPRTLYGPQIASAAVKNESEEDFLPGAICSTSVRQYEIMAFVFNSMTIISKPSLNY